MNALAQDVKGRIQVLACCISVLWLVQIVNLLSGYQLNSYGIIPRELVGLRGIVFSPFLHASIEHLAMNTVPLAILGGILIIRGITPFLLVSLVVALIGGLGVWFFGQGNSVHVGASGLVFGYFGFLIFKGIFDKQIGTLLISGVVLFLYGGMIWGVFPGKSGVSWEGHLFGLIGGVMSAYYSKGTAKRYP